MSVKLKQAFMFTLLFAGALQTRAECTAPANLAKQLRAAPGAGIYAALGSWYADHQQFGCAIGAFRKAAALEPDSARYQYLLGLNLYADGQFTNAVGPLRRSLQLDPDSTQTHLLLGTVLDSSNDRPSAELEWRLALATDPKSTLALESLSRDLLADQNYSGVISLLHPVDASGALTNTLAVDLAAAYGSSGLPEDAAALLQKRLRTNPASLQLAEALSGVLILESRFQDAVAALSGIAGRHPHDLHAQILLLQTLVLAHDPGAEALGQRLLTSAPKQWELLYFMGILHQQGDDYAAARDYFERSVAAKPGNADAHYRLGVVLNSLQGDARDKSKNETATRQELEKSISLGLDTPEVHFALARALRALGDTGGAQQQLSLYQQRLNAQAARAQAVDKAQQGDQAAAAGDLQQTVADYREALALDPQEPVLAYKLAMALDKAGDKAGERTALHQAVDLNPHMALAQNQLGYLDAGDGDAAAAVQHFQLAVGADPGFSKAWMNLAATLCLQAKWVEAREALHHVSVLGGDDASAKALLKQIDAMEAQAQP
jgi:Flp pilus assembly protein TadD